jgi:hypothetical protein
MTHDAIKDRDEALRRVDRRKWRIAATAHVHAIPSGRCGTGEALRFHILKLMDPPHHHNAWGSFTMGLVKSGLLEKTGRYLPMTGPKSHGRSTAEYRRTLSR